MTALGAVAVLGIGGSALAWPRASTRTYGVPKDDPDTLGYVQAAAARDLVMGAFVLWAACANDSKAMEAGLMACVLAPLADLIIVKRRRGNIPQLAIHASGVVGIAVTLAIVHSNI
jgi:hypothetical protein